jgi:hypothetical protein
MFTTQLISYPDSIVTTPRRSVVTALATMVAAGVVVVLIALALTGSIGASKNSLPQTRDLAPAWNRSDVTPTWERIAPVGPVSVATAPSIHRATVVRARP